MIEVQNARLRPGRRVTVGVGIALAGLFSATTLAGVAFVKSGQFTSSTVAADGNALRVTSYQTQIVPDDLLLTVSSNGLITSEIGLLSASSGATLGAVEAAYNPMVIIRRTHSELLVSDLVLDRIDGRGTPRGRLFVLDLTRSLAPKMSGLAIPDRVAYTLYSPGMVLSADEQYLYYLKRADCGQGCDDYSLGIIELDKRQNLGAAILPRDCGFAQLTPLGVTDLVVMCPQLRSVLRVTPGGTVIDVARFGGQGWPVYGGVSTDGRAFLITQEGAFLTTDAAGRVLDWKLLPAGNSKFSGLARWRLDDGELLLGVNESGESILTGAVRVDPRQPDRVVPLVLPAGTSQLAVLHGRLAALHDGKVSTIDARTGAEVSQLAVASARFKRLVAEGE